MNTAMILAAGRGERLKPLTDFIPKAMTPIHGIPLIEYHISNLVKAGFKRIIINHAHLGGQIRHYFGDGQRWDAELIYSPEPPGGLETGGGLFNALPLLGKEPFITVNADIFTDFAFHRLNLPQSALAHLVLVKNPSHNQEGDFSLQDHSFLRNENPTYTFAGIACYHPDLFQTLQPGRYSIIPRLRELANRDALTGVLFEGIWMDIGTKERWQQINRISQQAATLNG